MSSCFTSVSDDIGRSSDLHGAKVQHFFEECKYLLYFLQKNIFIGVFATPKCIFKIYILTYFLLK